jgi:hypothetical protein
MKTVQEVQDKINSLQEEIKALENKTKEGFGFPYDYVIHTNKIKVRKALVVGLKWTLKDDNDGK